MSTVKQQIEMFIPYSWAMLASGKSEHPHQLERRKAKYPNHFKTFKGVVFVSVTYLKALGLYQSATAKLKQLEN